MKREVERMVQHSGQAAAAGESDDAIIARVLNEDINAFELLMRRYNEWVFGIVSQRINHGQAAEITHEVFVQAYQSLPHYSSRRRVDHNPPADGFKHWLALIACRCCCHYWHTINRHPTCVISNLNAKDREQMEQTCQVAACETFYSDVGRNMTQEALLQAINQLEADDQTLLGLLYGQGYSQQETADILGISLASVKSRAGRAHARLRALIEQPANDREIMLPVASRSQEPLTLEPMPVPT